MAEKNQPEVAAPEATATPATPPGVAAVPPPPPPRAELFSRDRMKQHGWWLAAAHVLHPGTGPDLLLSRLADNYRSLQRSREVLQAMLQANRRIAPAGEWLLDNFHLIDEQVRIARSHLPKVYSRALPRLASGDSAGLPRVYDLAQEAIAHGDGRLDPDVLRGFVAAYQKATPLQLSELWAIPIMLRLALIENLRRVGAQLAADGDDRNLADDWADQLLEIAARDAKSVILVSADMARSSPPTSGAFVAELARRLQGQSTALALPLTWVEQRLEEDGSNIAQLVHAESQQQAADQVSVSNSIGSLRSLAIIDWRAFVEAMSAVEQVLREDPAGVYAGMAFATRDRYRHVVEDLARQSGRGETAVAAAVLELARAAGAEFGPEDRRAHIGYFLVDEGLRAAQLALGVRSSAWGRLRHGCRRGALPLYLCAIALVAEVVGAAYVGCLRHHGIGGWRLGLCGALALLAGSHLAIALVNWLATIFIPPHPLPRMDYSAGIPAPARTLVVVPTLLAHPEGVERLVEALEVRFLANRDPRLHFALLSDLLDAPQAEMPEDAALLELARHRIEQLNRKYPGSDGDQFFLLHRPRLWNAAERVWMGFERKRGKLAALNALLRGGERSAFALVVGDTADLGRVQYVLTLDSDTQLPRDAAWRCVGAMAHPLNRPRFDAQRGRVVEGYGILQPRVVTTLPSTNRSRYARLRGSEPGIDPYTRTVSDVYQDVFGEGSFIGKGIYDVDAFDAALRSCLPENRILSHDLLEGCYARSGLLSEILLYEDFPGGYHADAARHHRWIRGDWQLLPWLFPRVPCGGEPERRKNPLSALSRWKLFDNLRRSLEAPALVALAFCGWWWLPAPGLWTLSLLGLLLGPGIMATLRELLHQPKDVALGQHLRHTVNSAGRHALGGGFAIACLAFEAVYHLDAIARALFRTMISGLHRLQWTPSGQHRASDDLAGLARFMAPGGVIAVVGALLLAVAHPRALAAAGPVLALWALAPALAWWLGRVRDPHPVALDGAQRQFLARAARKTWAYFEVFAGPEDHYLPADNFQEQPAVAIAHRTSPTNIGLGLLGALAAHDFGFLATAGLLERIRLGFDSMDRLERYNGHFYNWYDTLTLRPLSPLYVSSVDSGNLAGHLLTLRAGLFGLLETPILARRWREGLADTLAQTGEAVGFRAAARAPLARLQSLHTPGVDTSLRAAWAVLSDVAAAAGDLAAAVAGSSDAQTLFWTSALARQAAAALDEIHQLAPWAILPEGPSAALVEQWDSIPTPAAVSALAEKYAAGSETPSDPWLIQALPLLRDAAGRVDARWRELDSLGRRAGEFAGAMSFDFLYDRGRRLLAIGYNVTDKRRDPGFYDLLASEARLCVYVAIAQGEIPEESWFALGRLLTQAGHDTLLMSWSGSMFEYLMPLLVMPDFENTLLDETCRAAVRRQVDYGNKRGVPWGISESGYNLTDARLNYQYRAFGVPGLGLMRGLGDDLVVAPYASALALLLDARAATANLQRLAGEGMEGRYGFYEAMDYTASRLPPGKSSAVVQSFLAHHQGMSLLAYAAVLLDCPMQGRFESDPALQATELLLHERIPRAAIHPVRTAEAPSKLEPAAAPAAVRAIPTPDTVVPEVQLLSNGRYHVMLTAAGGGYSRWNDLALTRWREDATADPWGSFCFVRDVESGEYWSTTGQPAPRRADRYEALFSEARAEFRRRDFGIECFTEVAVSAEDDIEIRRLRLTNFSRQRRVLEITSYAEVVIAPPAADDAHPAFNKLFIETELLPRRRAILCTRRPRSPNDPAPHLFHLCALHATISEELSFETDRARFIGRGGTLARPAALAGAAGELSNTSGSTLDPIVAIRYRLTLEPDKSATLNLITGVAGERDACLALVEKYQDLRLGQRVFDLAWTHSQVLLRQLNAADTDTQLYSRLAASVVYANPSLRADAATLASNRRGQSGLWGYSISGDLPIVLVEIGDIAHLDLVRQMVQAHAYWRLKGLAVDLVIWNSDHAGYRQQLQDQIMALISAGVEAIVADHRGGSIYVRAVDQIAPEDRTLFLALARVYLSDRRGSLAEQIPARAVVEAPPAARALPPAPPDNAVVPEGLQFWNGHGGFSADGREYVIHLEAGENAPAPWVNILANPDFGAVVSESGMASSWSENAHEFRLTPWENDPVTDAAGEAIYLRDEDTGLFWSPTPLPRRGTGTYTTRHGFGYSTFEHSETGIETELTFAVALRDPVRIARLKLRNHSGHARHLSATAYVAWVLGDLRAKWAPHVVTERDTTSGAILARNPYNTEFEGRVVFLQCSGTDLGASGDRAEFLGRNGTLANPAALRRPRLSGRLGAGLDPCAVFQAPFRLEAGEEREVVFVLGAGRDAAAASALALRYRDPAAAEAAFAEVRQYWQHTLAAVRVHTPDAGFNLLANGWLLYESLSSRVRGRNGYYQPGGAFGFRDQLQDTMALVHAEPATFRDQILLCASRQFLAGPNGEDGPSGDVQHWWHPPAGRGVRTRCSDDYLWLPLAVCRYLDATGESVLLDEGVTYLKGRALHPGEDSYYDLPASTGVSAPLYQHCVLAIEHGLRFGSHGLPLMGAGDWNDGMNLVGDKGQGESVWLAFMLYGVLVAFAPFAEARGDAPFATRCRTEADKLRVNIEANGWDGSEESGWYRRAYFDDGTPLGSAENPECRMDSIAQSWAVLSAAAPPARARQAMAAMQARLVDGKDGLIELLAPPFDKSDLHPGYIKGYPPGVRENGGQYTHAAVWAAMALARLGENEGAWKLCAMLLPTSHSSDPAAIELYKVEPYVIASDVCARPPHTGRGGWTWYTGAAAWMYRLMVESIAGVQLRGNRLVIQPCLPAHWPSIQVTYRYRSTTYQLTIAGPGEIELRDDGAVHEAAIPAARTDAKVSAALQP